MRSDVEFLQSLAPFVPEEDRARLARVVTRYHRLSSVVGLVARAVTDAGRCPTLHRNVRSYVRKSWPTMDRALTEVVTVYREGLSQ